MLRAFLLVALCAVSTPALAHVTANPDNGVAGKYFETKFRVSHGCDGSDTKEISIKLPKGMVTVKPQHKSGWTVEIRKSKLDKPVPAGHGKMADEQFDEIIWRGGPLPDSEYDEFGLLLKLTESAQTLWFPVTQTCVKGQNAWDQIPADGQVWHDLKSPAPFVKINAAPMDHSAHH